MIPAIVLAGGASMRMGFAKALLLDAERCPFIVRIVKTLPQAGADDVLVVTGPQEVGVRQVLEAAGLRANIVHNPDPSRGQLSSLQAALDPINRPGVSAVLVTLVDLPLVTAETVAELLDAYRRTRAPIVRPVNGNRHGHPVIFDRGLFSALRRADPAVGAKPILRAHEVAAVGVPIADEGAFQDIDTPEEYERLIGFRR